MLACSILVVQYITMKLSASNEVGHVLQVLAYTSLSGASSTSVHDIVFANIQVSPPTPSKDHPTRLDFMRYNIGVLIHVCKRHVGVNSMLACLQFHSQPE